MNARILSIGTELVLGQTADANAAWLARQLSSLGARCLGFEVVPDNQAAIAHAVRHAAGDADVLLVTGGLGPTPDDLTRAALADAMGVKLEFDAASLGHIETFFRSRGREMPAANRVQAMIPATAAAIENTCGTAPGIRARVGRADVFVMPGVPAEMHAMFDRDVRQFLAAAGGGATIAQQALRTFGWPESRIGEALADLMAPGRNPHVGTSAADLVISVRINAHGANPTDAGELLGRDAADIRRRLGDIVFGEGDDTLADAVAQLLTERRRTISTAESCTGGLIAKRLTDVPGSSAWFVRGYVTYSNEAKRDLLGVPADLLERHGAVSREVAEAMAVGCRQRSGTDYALSATGIAGPTGGTPAKPVGLVFIALAHPDGVVVKELRLGETLTRGQVRDRTTKIALSVVRLAIIGPEATQ